MTTIFRGRKLSLQGAEEVIYAEVAVALRDQIHHFNTGKSCNPFAVVMKIALHTDENGWAFPGNGSISASTGISTAQALASARTHLQNVRIDGHGVLEVYRERRPDGTFGRYPQPESHQDNELLEAQEAHTLPERALTTRRVLSGWANFSLDKHNSVKYSGVVGDKTQSVPHHPLVTWGGRQRKDGRPWNQTGPCKSCRRATSEQSPYCWPCARNSR